VTKVHEALGAVVGTQLNNQLPDHDCVFASLLVSTLPSVREVSRGGKRLDALRQRWRSLPLVLREGEVFVADQSPGMHHRMIVAQLSHLGLTRFADLLSLPIGRWHDLHARRGASLVASSLREEGLVFVPRGRPPSMRECFGETTPVSDQLLHFLRS
jgi:hypothetical protein